MLVSVKFEITQGQEVFFINSYAFGMPKSSSWFPKQLTSTLSFSNGKIIYYPSKIVLKAEGKNKSPENKTNLSLDPYWSKAVLNLEAPPTTVFKSS